MTRATLAAVGLAVLAGPAAAQTYSSSADYSNASNPNGVWTYGSTPALAANGYVPSGGTSLTVYNTNNSFGGQPALRAWTTSGSPGVPSAGFNSSATDLGSADAVFHPMHLFVHAGSVLASVARFTAPAAGTYSLAVHFENRTTNLGWPVYVYKGGTLLDSATFANFTPGGSHDHANPSLVLAANDTVEFMAGPRSDGTFNSTVTQVDAVLTFIPVPEPATVLAVAVVGLAVLRWRRT